MSCVFVYVGLSPIRPGARCVSSDGFQYLVLALRDAILTRKKITLPFHIVVDAVAALAVRLVDVFLRDEFLYEDTSIALQQANDVVERSVCGHRLNARGKLIDG